MISSLLLSLLGLFSFGAMFGGSSPSAASLSAGSNRKPAPVDPDHDLAPVDPDPTPVDPDPTPVDPDPTPVDPDPTPVDPDPTPVDPDPTPVDPDPAPVDPDPTPVDHDPTPVDPDPAPVDPDPTPVDPDPTPVDPDPTPVDPDPSVDPDPTPVDPDPTPPDNPNPEPPVQNVDASDGGSVAPTVLSNGVDVAGGRVTTLELENAGTIQSVQVISGPQAGNLTVNPDNTLALVMSGENYSGSVSFSYEVTYQDGSSEVLQNTVDVLAPTQDAGWGEGNFYMLETDENGDVIVEYGDNHREVYVSGSNDALSLGDIASLEGLNVNQITAGWLQDNPEYGGSADMALDSEAGMQLWYGMTGVGNAPSSDWLLFERGYEYDDIGRLIDSGTQGEDPLSPIYVTSYGVGDKPILNTNVLLSPYEAAWAPANANIVISDISVTGGITALSGSNLMVSDVDITNNTVTTDNVMGISIQNVDGFTLYNSSITDVYRTVNPEGADYWGQGGLMASGGYIKNTDGLLIEGTLFDQNGWAPDYQYDRSTDGGQSPTMFNHNLYLQSDTTDVTLRDNIIMKGASYGLHARGGGFFEDNIFLDNNVAVDLLGGDYRGAGPVGNFSLFTNNLITSAGNKEIDGFVGAITWGLENAGQETTLLDNIIANLADPNNPEEIAEKSANGVPLNNETNPFYDDTIIYNWGAGNDQNIDGLDTSALDATTIQIFTQQLLGDPNAGITDLATFLRAQANGELDDFVDADLIIGFFQAGFGLSVDARLTADEVRFIPNDLGDGIRWDNRMNWSTDDLPGTIAGDSVDLGGNWVNYGGTTTLDGFDFGSGGELTVGQGRLTIEGMTQAGDNGAVLNTFSTGQVWMNGYADPDLLEINVDGGRFVNTGTMEGDTALLATDGQTVLASDGATWDIEAGSSVAIDGSEASIGFDGELGDTGVLRLNEDGTLAFRADSQGFATIEEFRTGAMGDDPDIASGVNLGLGSLELDISALAGSAGTYELISVDELIGEFSDISLVGLPGNQDANLVIDYETDTLTVQLTAAGSGSGSMSLQTVGSETDMDSADAAALWEALTAGQGTYSDSAATALYLNGEVTEEMVI